MPCMFTDESNKLEAYTYIRTKQINVPTQYKSLHGPTQLKIFLSLFGIITKNYTYIYKQDLALNKRQWFICHKIKPNLSMRVIQLVKWIYLFIYLCMFKGNRFIGLVGRVIANDPGDQRLLKMVFDTSLLNTQHYKVCIKGKVEQSRE